MLSTNIQYLKGIGPKRSKSFEEKGVETVEELLYYFPRRYEDRTKFLNIASLKEAQTCTIQGQILVHGQRNSWRRRSFSITEALIGDKTGRISCIWFNQPYLKNYLKPGLSMILYGKVENYNGRLQMNNPEYEFLDDQEGDSLNTGRIVPIYSLPKGFSQRSLRSLIKNSLDEYLPKIKDALPYDLRKKNNLLNLAESLHNIHFPEGVDLQKEAHRRLSFEEFFIFQLPLVLRKLTRDEKRGIAHTAEGNLINGYIASLPFKLTGAQLKVFSEIKTDMAGNYAMQRLLQGDVGSGKTVIAVMASLIAIQSGHQAAIMAPTEILARQHYEKILKQFENLNFNGRKLNIILLTGQGKDKEKAYLNIKEGKADIVIGTHALLQENLFFKDLSFIVIDEQHKFGIGQRALLPRKGNNPDVLIMTATPIPRTLAITLYGDLDISVINQLPSGRLPVKTLLFEEKNSKEGYTIAKEELRLGHQGYIVFPVIEDSYALDLAGAKRMFVELKRGEFKDFRLGLIHGRLKPKEQEDIMLKFKNKELDLLVSTTILEVGIDIPNATCMIIASAERFGLSQLHQLRGRIGRGNFNSYCVLISDCPTEDAKARLGALVSSCDGFCIAEEDLKIRGPGEFFGKRQHGLAELKIADPLTQMHLLKAAREEAVALLNKDLHLTDRLNLPLKEKLLSRFPEYKSMVLVG